MAEPFFHAVAHEEAVLAIVVQLFGMFLILSSTAMFVKQEYLHKIEHILQMNMLLSSTVFLLIDWILVLPGTWPCEAFSLSYITFGPAITFSTVGIAFGRYQKMMGTASSFSRRIHIVIELVLTWVISLFVIVYPLIEKLRPIPPKQQQSQFVDIMKVKNDTMQNAKWMCLFKGDLMYQNMVSSSIFLLVAVILPLNLMMYFYIKIFKKLRKARMNAWLNHIALQRSRETQVIKCGGRKANVFQMMAVPNCNQNAQRFNEMAYTREKSVMLKGIFSAAVILVCWLPYAVMWMYTSINEFKTDYLPLIRYLMIISKISVILNVLHYICLNVKYRNLYIQTVFGQLTLYLQSIDNENEEQTSQINSQVVGNTSSSAFDKSIFTTRASKRVLEPIQENQPRDNFEPIQENVKIENSVVNISESTQGAQHIDGNQQNEDIGILPALARIHKVNIIHPQVMKISDLSVTSV